MGCLFLKIDGVYDSCEKVKRNETYKQTALRTGQSIADMKNLPLRKIACDPNTPDGEIEKFSKNSKPVTVTVTVNKP